MTRTEAADRIAIEVRVFAREHGLTEITRRLCEERVSELRGRFYAEFRPGHHAAAKIANPKTVYRLATRYPL